jgi:hypothetical protein
VERLTWPCARSAAARPHTSTCRSAATRAWSWQLCASSARSPAHLQQHSTLSAQPLPTLHKLHKQNIELNNVLVTMLLERSQHNSTGDGTVSLFSVYLVPVTAMWLNERVLFSVYLVPVTAMWLNERVLFSVYLVHVTAMWLEFSPVSLPELAIQL